jgi:hypothetical protein
MIRLAAIRSVVMHWVSSEVPIETWGKVADPHPTARGEVWVHRILRSGLERSLNPKRAVANIARI